jgi:outer membrane protein TolC
MHQLTKWLNWIVNPFLSLILCFVVVTVSAQTNETITIEQAYQMARQNYPLIMQRELIEKSSFLTIENIKTSFLPQLNVSGQASYQSDVTTLDIPIPNVKINPVSKDQYKVWADVNQLLYDGGMSKSQQQVQKVSAAVDDQKTEVELYKLKDRINQLYLGILLLDAQLKQTESVKSDLGVGLKTVNAQVNNGVAFKSGALVLEAQLLQTEQRVIEIKSNRKALLNVFSLFINRPLAEEVQLVTPVVKETVEDENIARPELKLYSYQDSLWKTQQQLINAKNMPKASLFAQGGYGRPTLNFLRNDFNFYYLGGLKLNWSLGNYYTSKRERQILTVNEKLNEVQRDVFLFNTGTQLTQQKSETDKLNRLVEVDEQIIDIRKKITEAAKAQLQNAVITSNDYLREVNAEDQARLSLVAHQIQLLQAKINYQNIKGNQ